MQVQDIGTLDYVSNGEIIKNVACKSVLVSSSDDLSILQKYAPGTIAYTAGFKQMWQLSPSGDWVGL